MKKHLIILLIMLSACSAFGQIVNKVSANQNNSYEPLKSFKGDTLGYVQHNFIDNKWKYIGKNLNTLLNDVEIPIKSYLRGTTSLSKTIMPVIILQFYTWNQASKRADSPDKPVNIIITWSQPLPMDSVNIFFKQNKGEWTDAERKYYGKQIIGDILTTKWRK